MAFDKSVTRAPVGIMQEAEMMDTPELEIQNR